MITYDCNGGRRFDPGFFTRPLVSLNLLIERRNNNPRNKTRNHQAFLAVNDLPDGDLLHRPISAHDGLLSNNPAYPNTPFDGPTFKGIIERFTIAAAAVLHDGGKTAVEERNKSRKEAILMYRILGHYVETACKNDMNTFVSSGFTAVSKPQATSPQPLPAPDLASLKQGQAGQMIVTFKPVPKALHYQLSYAVVPAAGASVNPTTPGRGDWTSAGQVLSRIGQKYDLILSARHVLRMML